MTRRIGLMTVAFGVAALASTAARSAPSVGRTVPCSESIASTKFPYLSPGYRPVLGVVSAPRAYTSQVIRGNGTPRFPYFFKAGLVVRASGQSVVVNVPPVWRDRAAIAWGYGGHGVFSSLRISGCQARPSIGFAYSGGFYLRSAPACLPLIFRVGQRSATVRFGLGRRCP
jgi:hypothetical protein